MNIFPILDEKNSSTKDKIISILSSNPKLSTKKINNILRKQYAIHVTYQAVHKTLKQLLSQRVLEYDDKLYSINKEWIKNLKVFTDKLSPDSGEDTSFSTTLDYNSILESPGDTKILLKTRQEFDEFYYQIRKHLLKKLEELDENERIVFRSFWHLYYPLANPTQEYELIDTLVKLKAKTYTFVIGETPLDKWAAKIYKNSPVKVFFGEHIAFTNMIFIYGNVVMDVYYDYKIIELFDEVFIKTKTINSLTVKQAVNDLYTSYEPIYITINKDPAVVNILKKLFLYRLSKHDIFLSTHDVAKEFEEIMHAPLLKNIIKEELGQDTVVLNRKSNSYIIKLKEEKSKIVKRLILVPPKGCTSNYQNELSCHPEVRYATVSFKGGIKKNSNRYIKIKQGLKYAYYLSSKIPNITDFAEAKIDYDNELYKESVKSSNESFYVVKEDGEGFYHNLINMTDNWIVLVLNKHIKEYKDLNIESNFSNLTKSEVNDIQKFHKMLIAIGDNIFYRAPDLIKKICELEVDKLLPIFINLLNIKETGMHEQCTVFALIIKIGRKNPAKTIEILGKSLTEEVAPSYYLSELLTKIKKYSVQ